MNGAATLVGKQEIHRSDDIVTGCHRTGLACVLKRFGNAPRTVERLGAVFLDKKVGEDPGRLVMALLPNVRMSLFNQDLVRSNVTVVTERAGISAHWG